MNPLQKQNMNEIAIGSGMTFPIELSESKHGQGWYPVKGDVNLIKNNLQSLILYPIGFRFRQEDYGTRITSCLEEPNTQALRFYIKAFILNGIQQFEPRITYQNLYMAQREDQLLFQINYGINLTALNDNLSTSITRPT